MLGALGVILIPMLLEGARDTLGPKMEELPECADPRSGEPRESFRAADAVPDEPGKAVVMDSVLPEAIQEKPAVAPVPAPQQPQAAPTNVKPVSDPEPAPAPAPEPEPVKEPVDPGPLGSWIVQVGSFSSERNALVLRDKLRKDGFVTQVEKARGEGKTHYRVRVGPVPECTDAARAQRELSAKFRLKACALSSP